MKEHDKEITGGELTEYPNEKYRQFFEKFKEIDTLDISQWKPVHVLGYFCKKYKEQYNINYQFKFNSPAPSKCFEVFQIKRLAMNLSSKPEILKDYIDWIFINKVVKAKRRLTSISFMTVDGVLNEYKINILLKNNKSDNIERTTPLLEKYKNILLRANFKISTYGELAFLLKINPLPLELINALDQMKQIGFDPNILNKIV